MREGPVDVGDPEGVKENEHQARRQAILDETPLYRVMQTYHGREFVWSILEKASLFCEQIVLDSFSATAYNHGRQSSAREIFATLQQQDYIMMFREMQDEAHRRVEVVEQERTEKDG